MWALHGVPHKWAGNVKWHTHTKLSSNQAQRKSFCFANNDWPGRARRQSCPSVLWIWSLLSLFYMSPLIGHFGHYCLGIKPCYSHVGPSYIPTICRSDVRFSFWLMVATWGISPSCQELSVKQRAKALLWPREMKLPLFLTLQKLAAKKGEGHLENSEKLQWLRWMMFYEWKKKNTA